MIRVRFFPRKVNGKLAFTILSVRATSFEYNIIVALPNALPLMSA